MKKIALVTGAGAGIGQAIALELAQAGYKVYANARNEEKIKDTLKKASELSAGSGDDPKPDIEPLIFDVTDIDDVREKISGLDRLDCLVNNAGVCVSGKFDEITVEDWDLTLNTNVKGYFFVTKYALKKMKRGGAIVNMTSGAAKTGGDFVSLPYSTSKGAINSLTISFARDLAPAGIRVNAVSPGFVDTNMLVRSETLTTEYYDSIIPLGRLGVPADISHAVRFLLSEEASFITGQIIEVNGGDIMG